MQGQILNHPCTWSIEDRDAKRFHDLPAQALERLVALPVHTGTAQVIE